MTKLKDYFCNALIHTRRTTNVIELAEVLHVEKFKARTIYNALYDRGLVSRKYSAGRKIYEYIITEKGELYIDIEAPLTVTRKPRAISKVVTNNPFLWRTYVPYQIETAVQASGRNEKASLSL